MPAKETLQLPTHFTLEPELLEQLSGRPGHQRCVDGNGELLLVVHEVPKARVPEREALFFWKQYDGTWLQSSGPGLSELAALLDRFEREIDGHEEVLNIADSALDIFGVLRHSAPLKRTTRNLSSALEQVLTIDPDDREMIALRDRAREIDRAADLLHTDAMTTLEFWRAERAEDDARANERLGRIAFRLNLLAGFFLPLVALAGLFGMNVDLPPFVKPLFWVILLGGLGVGAGLVFLVARKTGKWTRLEDEED